MLKIESEEEYNLMVEKISKLKKELFDVRFNMAMTRDVQELKLLEEKVSVIKKAIARTKVVIKTYELKNNIEIKKRGKK